MPRSPTVPRWRKRRKEIARKRQLQISPVFYRAKSLVRRQIGDRRIAGHRGGRRRLRCPAMQTARRFAPGPPVPISTRASIERGRLPRQQAGENAHSERRTTSGPSSMGRLRLVCFRVFMFSNGEFRGGQGPNGEQTTLNNHFQRLHVQHLPSALGCPHSFVRQGR